MNRLAWAVSPHGPDPATGAGRVGAFISVTVAATIASGIVEQAEVTVPIVFAGLVGAILCDVITWFLGIPSSSSHALIGGVVGSVLAAIGSGAVIWDGIASKVVIPAVLAPLVCGVRATRAAFLPPSPSLVERRREALRRGLESPIER